MTYPTMDELIRDRIQRLADSIAFNYEAIGEEYAMRRAKESSTLGYVSWNNALRLAEVELQLRYHKPVSLAKYDRTN